MSIVLDAPSFMWMTVPQKKKQMIKIQFHTCSYSCGYRKAFEEYENILGEKYPQILIEGANYDPPGINFYMSKIILAAKMLFILIIVSSYDIWGSLGQAVPRWYTWCAENKIYACMMIFFLGNMLESQVSGLTNTPRGYPQHNFVCANWRNVASLSVILAILHNEDRT